MRALAPVEADAPVRRALVWETVIVLGLSLGRSAIWSILSIVDSLTRPEPIASQTTTLNPSYVPDRPWLDLLYQVANIVLPLVPVVLVCYLLLHVHRPDDRPLRAIGLDRARVLGDTARGFGLAALIGIPGLAFYLLSRHLGINLEVSAANLGDHWWTVPVYIARAAMNGVLEEVIVVAYLFTRWAQAGRSTRGIVIVAAIIRGSYHLYQGFGGFLGNIVMGLVFGAAYARTRRVLPLVIAHTLIDVVAYLGYALLNGRVSWL